MHLLRCELGLSYKKIGSVLGGKDHTTVLHACRKIEGEITGDPALFRDLEEISGLFRESSMN